jgi:hypothetical protein
LYCTLYLCTLTLTRRQLQALVALSLAFVSEVFIQPRSVHCIGYNFASASRLQFRLGINKSFSFILFLLEVVCSYHSTQF